MTKMQIAKQQEGDNVTFSLSGRLDTTTAPQLEAEITAVEATAQKIALDMSDLEYVSSAGLRVLLAAHKIMSKKGGLSLSGVNPGVMEVFAMTGFSDILHIG
jgi:anti-sigma B factor antagonist